MALLKVFVYGTLKPGECNYPRYCEGKVVDSCPAIARGKLFHLRYRGYPAMMVGEGQVQGILLTFADSTVLNDLDRLEDYQPQRPPAQNEYQRQQVEIFHSDWQSLGWAWAYFMLPDRVQTLGGMLLPEGFWSQEISHK